MIESERRRFFRIDLGKANMTLAADADWYRFESVELLNGDSVGVPTSYDKPDSDPENLARIDKVFMTILDRLASEGRTVNPTSGATYAPHVFAQEREAKEAKTGKKALAAAMKRLFEAKLIHVERVESGNHTVQSIARRRQ